MKCKENYFVPWKEHPLHAHCFPAQHACLTDYHTNIPMRIPHERPLAPAPTKKKNVCVVNDIKSHLHWFFNHN